MPVMINTTAGALKAILALIDPVNTPKIAYDKDEYAKPLADKIKEAIGERDGSQPAYISFQSDEEELQRQFNGVVKNMSYIFDTFARSTDSW